MRFLKLYARLTRGARGSFYGPTAQEICRRIDESEQKVYTLLDIGCGPGDLIFEIAKLKPDLVMEGVDLSAGFIRMARERKEKMERWHPVTFNVGDANDLGYEDNARFSFVLSTGVLHCLRDPGRAIRGWIKVLRSGGDLWIYDPSPLMLGSSFLNFKDRLLLFAASKFFKDIPPRMFSVQEMARIIQSADIERLVSSVKIINRRDYVKVEIIKTPP